MASELPPEQRASYSAIIDDILSTADLNTVSAKAIRKDLQARVEYDLTPQKAAITQLIMERFDKVHEKTNGTGTTEPAPTANGAAHAEEDDEEDEPTPTASAVKRKQREDDDDDLSDVEDSSPAPKKAKKSKGPRAGGVESDEQLAARLQAELDAQTQSRSTRGGGAKRKQPVKRDKKTKKKSSAKVGADDDSDLESGDGVKPEKERKGGFHKPMNLSEPLSALLGETQLSRPQTVKKIWEYVKARDLQDPKDKRQIVCDEAMRAVFKGDRVHMFTMNKLLANHLYPAEEAV